MPVSDSVCAVTVSYNNSREFTGLMERLAGQTHPLSAVICVDNSNETYADIIKEALKSRDYGYKVWYCKTRQNTGSAGGYAVGMSAAYDSGADWVWLNDQDGRPDYDCLESLLEASRKCRKKGIMAPAVFCENEGKTVFLMKTGLLGKIIPLKRAGKELKRLSATGTSGMLVHRSVIREIGVYNGRVCFSGNEDFEFCRRAGACGINICYAGDAGYFHPDVMVKRNKRELPLPGALQEFMPYYLGYADGDNPASYKKCVSSAYMNSKYNSRPAGLLNLLYSCVRSLTGFRNGKFSYRKTLRAYREGYAEAESYGCVFKMENYRMFLSSECVIGPRAGGASKS